MAVVPLEAVAPLLTSMLVPHPGVVSPLLAKSSLSVVAVVPLEVVALLAVVVFPLDSSGTPCWQQCYRCLRWRRWRPS